MIFLIFFIFFIESYRQKLIIDSRVNQYNIANIGIFQNQFSIWFIAKGNKYEYNTIFQIKSKRKEIAGLYFSEDTTQLRSEQQKYEFGNGYSNEWNHVVVKIHIQSNYIFFELQFFQLSRIFYQVMLNTTLEIKDDIKIVSIKQSDYLCLIYDSIQTDVQPIVYKKTFHTFIMPIAIVEYLYHNNSSAILYTRKIRDSFIGSNILNLFYGNQIIFSITEYESKLFFIFNQTDVVQIGQIEDDQWFTIQIDFLMENINLELSFQNINNFFQRIPKNYDEILYSLEITSKFSNYQQIQLIQTFKIRLEDVDKGLFDITCDINQIYDIDLDECLSIDYFFQTKMVSNNGENYMEFQHTYSLYSQYVINVFSKKLIAQFDLNNLTQKQFIDSVTILDEQYFTSKNVLVLGLNEKKILCQDYYFGNDCKSFLKKCILGHQNQCAFCSYGFVDIKQKCQKCPKGCLICQFINYKIDCLIPQNQYYITFDGQNKQCHCQYCNYHGVCQNNEQIQQVISNCQANEECLLQECLQQKYLSIKSQNCVQLSNNQVFQIYYQLSQSQSFELELQQMQYSIVQSYQLNNTRVAQNKYINQLHFSIQLYNNYNKVLQRDLSDDQYYILNKFNLNCLSKVTNPFGHIVCLEYENRDYMDEKIFEFSLNLVNVTYYFVSENIRYVIYKQQQYESVEEFVSQIEDIGLQYTKIYIDLIIINYQLLLNYNTDLLEIDKEILPLHLRYAEFHIFLKLPEFYDPQFSYICYLKFDYLYILDQSIHYNLYLRIINTQMATIQNFSIDSMDHKVEFFFDMTSIKTVRFFGVQLNCKFELSIQFSDILEIQTSSFVSFYNSVVKLKYIKNFIFQNCTIYSMNAQLQEQFQIQYTDNTQLDNLTVYVQKSNQAKVIVIKNSKYTTITNIEINVNESILTSIIYSQSQYTIINNIESVISRCYAITLFSLHSNFVKILQFRSVIQEGDLSNILHIFSQEINLRQLHFHVSNSYNNIILCIKAEFFNMKYFNYTARYDDFEQSISERQFVFNFSIIITMSIGNIINCTIEGLRFSQSGLITLSVKDKVFIKNFVINHIIFFTQTEHHMVEFQAHSDAPTYLIQNMLIDSVLLEIPNFSILMVMQNFKKNQIFNLKIKSIKSVYRNPGFIFTMKGFEVDFQLLDVQNCEEINFIKVESYITNVNQLNYFNNTQDVIFSRQDQIVLTFCFIKISNSIISQFKGSIVIAQSFLVSLLILINNMTIQQLECFTNLFELDGEPIKITILNTIIQNQIAQANTIINNSVFHLQFGTIFAKNISIINFKQSIFMIFSSIKSQLNQINVQIIDLERKTAYLIIIIFSQIIIQNFQAQTISNCLGIIEVSEADEHEQSYLNNLFFNQINNVVYVIHYHTESQKQYFHMIQDIILIKSNVLYLFSFGSEQLADIEIKNLFTNEAKFLIAHIKNIRFKFSYSLIFSVTLGDYLRDQISLQTSEMIAIRPQYASKFQLTNSQIYDSKNLLTYHFNHFFITLSFDGGNNIQQFEQMQQKDGFRQFYIRTRQQTQVYFYIPSGQKLSYYKRLNLITLQYEQIYLGLLLIVKGFENFESYLSCKQQQFYNNDLIEHQNTLFRNFTISQNQEKYDIDQIFVINPHNINYTVFKISCSSNNITAELNFNVKSFPCQLGEYLYLNQCLQCNISQNQYSVEYNATKCQYIDSLKIQSAKIGLIQLQKNYWRYKLNSQIIELCDSQYCNGGWIPGDRSCVRSRIGALCNECDLYNIRGDGHYTNNNGECILCKQLNTRFILQFLFTIIFQMFITLYSYQTNYNISNQYLFYKIGFKQFYQILYRQSVDQTSIIIKMYSNYLFLLYIIRQNLDIIGKIFIVNINIMNNPTLIFQAQLQCLLSVVGQVNVIYSQYFYEILQTLFIISLALTIYFISISLRLQQFKIGFIIFFLDSVFIYNLKIIVETSAYLLSYKHLSQQKWIRLNLQYLFYSDTHMKMIRFIFPMTVIMSLFPLIFPMLSQKLNILNKKAKRIFSIYYQEYKPSFFFWEYCLIYTKYLIMVIQIYQNQSYNIVIVVIILIQQFNYNSKPYHLQNLNSFEFNLFVYYSIQLNSQILGSYAYILIILMNLYILLLFLNRIKKSYYLLNINKVIKCKKFILQKFPRLKIFIGIDKHQRQVSNIVLLRQFTRSKIMKKQSLAKFQTHYQFNTEVELVELVEGFKQTISIQYPSRQE